MPETNETITSERSIYELGYHIVPTVGESGLPEEVANVKATIERNGGIFIMEEYPVLTQLAYTMVKVKTGKREKHSTAYFGWVKFELETRHTTRLKEDLDQNEHLLRYLLIKTVREDTRAPKRVKTPQETGSRAPVKTAEKSAPISEEELDRSIAELVVE